MAETARTQRFANRKRRCGFGHFEPASVRTRPGAMTPLLRPPSAKSVRANPEKHPRSSLLSARVGEDGGRWSAPLHPARRPLGAEPHARGGTEGRPLDQRLTGSSPAPRYVTLRYVTSRHVTPPAPRRAPRPGRDANLRNLRRATCDQAHHKRRRTAPPAR